MNELSPNKLLTLTEVLKLIPVGKTTWYNGMKTGQFPHPVKLTVKSRKVFWKRTDIEKLIDDLCN